MGSSDRSRLPSSDSSRRLDRELLLDLVLSRSYCAKLPPAEREPILDAVGELYDEIADSDGVRLPYVTECFRAAKLEAT